MREKNVAGPVEVRRRMVWQVGAAAVLLLVLLTTGCALDDESEPGAVGTEPATAVASETQSGGMMPGMGMGPGSGMMARHRAPVPEEYAGLASPVEATEDSLEQGAEVFVTYCATCHGDGGMGDGPTGAQLDPAPAPIAHTSQMMGEDYLFWRISEGGALEPFNSAMPSWKGALDEEERWHVINYVRALGAGTVTPRGMMGGATYDLAAELAQRTAMVETAVGQGVITQDEADAFMDVHAAVDELMAAGMSRAAGNAGAMQEAMLNQLTSSGAITAAQAATFRDVHDRLVDAGLMQ